MDDIEANNFEFFLNNFEWMMKFNWNNRVALNDKSGINRKKIKREQINKQTNKVTKRNKDDIAIFQIQIQI